MLEVGLVGGGQMPLTGDVSLVHHGLLLLDELPEFMRHVLEVLRQPLEKSITRIQSRAHRRPYGIGHNGGSSQGRDEFAHPMQCTPRSLP
jgi:Magnesium chelatase, subunit ChlI